MRGERDRILRNLRRRRIAVVGLGVSNQALLRFLLSRGARSVAAGDSKTPAELGPAAEWLAGLPVRLRLGPGYLDVLEDADLAFLTPGMRKDLPEIAAARARGVEITSEMGLFLALCRAGTVGITGSAGKTTTTSLTGEMLARSGLRVYVGGNIGTPLIERVLEFRPADTVVLELSSFQLQLVDRSPNVAAVLNVSPNHLDIHHDYDEYVQAKKGIYRYQLPGDWAVFGAANAETLTMARERGEGVALFGPSDPAGLLGGLALPYRAFIGDDRLFLALPDRPAPLALCRTSEVRLRGQHNLLNVLAASLVTVLAGGRPEAAAQVATTFEGLEHRLEPVLECGGVTFVNDSIATSPDRTEAALASYPGPLHLIAGGYDKKIPFDTLGETIVRSGKVRKVVLIGQTAPKIRRALEAAADRVGKESPTVPAGVVPAGMPSVAEVATLEEAVREAFADAGPGTTVLLSPACASFDMFRSFEARGRAFKEAVRDLARRSEAAAPAGARGVGGVDGDSGDG
ncbi:MAG: UDP-N-acetylmuramoyl-L-alanine--D-glutamate ligase [Bacillota bacterium]